MRFALLVLALTLACGDDGRRVSRDLGPAALDAATERDFGPRPDLGDELDDVIVYAHSPRELFAFDPRENTVSRVGRFRLPSGDDAEDMTDIAVDSEGNLYTCSFVRLFRVDSATAESTIVGTLGVGLEVQFNALTFVPRGVLDPASEVLVAATASGDYYRLDPATGTASLVGIFADGYGSSGDLVSVEGAGTFMTAMREGLGNDQLVRLDPATGAITPIGSTGATRLFGLAYWRDQLFAFDSFGRLLTLDITTGASTVVETDTGADSFFGAGVTTIAPTTPLI